MGAAVLAVLAVLATVLVLRSGDGAGTELRLASPPLAAPAPGPVPTALVEAWRAPSPSTPRPVVAGPAVVTAGPVAGGPDGSGGRVVGHDPVTGAEAWTYRRPEVPCTVGEGFGDVLAVFAVSSAVGEWCSSVAALDPATGARGPARDADVRGGTALVADDSHVVATGPDYLEVWRSDLVATLEYGALPTPVQADPQPRAGCDHGSVALERSVLGVLERCPGETSDRISLLDTDPSSSDRPTDRLSTLTGVVGGRLLAVTAERVALAAPDGTLRVLDAAGAPVATVPLGAAAGPTADPPGLDAGLRVAGPVLLWWTGRATVALDPVELVPRWVLPGTLGAGTAVPAADTSPPTLLVPVPGGLDVVDAGSGAARGRVPVDRARDRTPAVAVAMIGTTVVEQRGPSVVALRPPP